MPPITVIAASRIRVVRRFASEVFVRSVDVPTTSSGTVIVMRDAGPAAVPRGGGAASWTLNCSAQHSRIRKDGPTRTTRQLTTCEKMPPQCRTVQTCRLTPPRDDHDDPLRIRCHEDRRHELDAGRGAAEARPPRRHPDGQHRTTWLPESDR